MADEKYPSPPPYSPPQPGYTSNQPSYTYNQPNTAVSSPPRTIVIVDSPPVIVVNNLGPYPTSCYCNTCKQQVTTYTRTETSLRTHVVAGLLCLFGCWPCVWIPYCADACKKIQHYCPICNTYLGCNI
ncbi:cell death-inducing p53-target protein 1 homolog [Colias croceus]|uniref:cell death-inducing p53-target protein 1 homolog n=1 Tax=Colias crocea TaxID=72248 RepID=UPI001E27BCEF|nr:cell death-inducing p53-target protein 1 homolog [Colias croceus]